MEKPKSLAFRVFPKDVPSNYRVSIKNALKLIYWFPLGLVLTINIGLKLTRQTMTEDKTISYLEGYFMFLSVIFISPFATIWLLLTGLFEAFKGRLMSVEIEETCL